MNKMIIAIILTLALVLKISSNCLANDYTSLENIQVEEIMLNNEHTPGSLPYIQDQLSIEQLKDLMRECTVKMEAAHQMAEAARTLGYEETNPVIVLAGSEWTYWHNNWLFYNELTKR